MTQPYRIVFMGTPAFAVPSLKALLHSGENILAVVCQPDRRQGRGRQLAPPPVKELAQAHGIPVLQPASIRTDEFLEHMGQLAPDLIVVAAYGKILPGALLNQPPLGTINVHGSLLPKYRGAAPIQWALIRGEQETGVTIMQMDEGMDTGDILLTASLPITEQDTAGTLFVKLADLGGQTLVEALTRLKGGHLRPIPQDDRLASEAPLLTKEMGHLDWQRPASELHCLIRGLDPWPSAYGFLGTSRYRFFAPQVIAGSCQEAPGTIRAADKKGLLIATGKDNVLIREIQPAGRKRMSVAACLCGLPLKPGQRFT